MKKFTPLAAIASGLGGYLALALLSSSPNWFDDSKDQAERSRLEVPMAEDNGAEAPAASIADSGL